LKKTDPKLFDFKINLKTIKNKKITPYTKKCQQERRHPVPITDESLAKVKRKLEPPLKYKNNSSKNGKIINYVCLDKTYKYPGFTGSSTEHPEGLCLICCRKKSFNENEKTTAYKRYQECSGIDTQNIADEAETTDQQVNIKYIKKYGKISVGRYSWLPKQLMDLLNMTWICENCLSGIYEISEKLNESGNQIDQNNQNTEQVLLNDKIEQFDKMDGGNGNENGNAFPKIYNKIINNGVMSKCEVNKARYISSDSDECVLLYSPQQEQNNQYLNVIEHCLDIEYGTLLDKLIDFIYKNPELFDLIENGKMVNTFKTIKNYVDFLKGNTLKKSFQQYTEDLIILYAKKILGMTFISLLINEEYYDQNRKKMYTLRNKIPSSVLYGKLIRKDIKFCVILKVGVNHYLLSKGSQFLYTINSQMWNAMMTLIMSNLGSSANNNKLELTEHQMETIFDKIGKYKICGQYVIKLYNSNLQNALCICKRNDKERSDGSTGRKEQSSFKRSLKTPEKGKLESKIFFPVKINIISNLPVIHEYSYPEINFVMEFLIDFYIKGLELPVEILKMINPLVFNNKIVGFLLISKQIIYIEPSPILKKINKFGEILLLNYEPKKIEHFMNETGPGTGKTVGVPNNDFLKNGYISFVYSVNHFIFTRKNKTIREQILTKFREINNEFNSKIIKSRSKDTLYETVIRTIKEFNLSETDSELLTKIFNISLIKNKKEAVIIFGELFGESTFMFDLQLRNELLELLDKIGTMDDFGKSTDKTHKQIKLEKNEIKDLITKKIDNILKNIIVIVKKRNIEFHKRGIFIENCFNNGQDKKNNGSGGSEKDDGGANKEKKKLNIGCKNGKLELTQFEYNYFRKRFIEELINNNIKKEIVLRNKLTSIEKYTYIW
jgi:hypothetical protein